MDHYYSEQELQSFGFKSVGKHVRISRKSSIYGAKNIRISDHVRIDDFTVITARDEMVLGQYVHISCQSFLHGHCSIRIGNFAQVSSRVGLYTSSADCSGEGFTNPMLPPGIATTLDVGEIILGDYVIIGAGATVLQGVTVHEGAVVGAHSLVNKSLQPWTISVGSPARFLKERKSETVLKIGREVLANSQAQ